MYTISMRPQTRNSSINSAMNFEQERADWAPSTFTDTGDGCASDVGLVFYSPLQAVDIEPAQLAAMIAGLDTAYEALVKTLFEGIDAHLNKALYSSAEQFIRCLPNGLWRAKAQDWSEIMPTYDNKFIVLRNPNGDTATWDGYRWGLIGDTELGYQGYDTAGACFGWTVLYNDKMDMSMVRDPKDLCRMLATLADALIEINTDERLYAACIFTVR